MTSVYCGLHEALYGELRALLDDGIPTPSRNGPTRALNGRSIKFVHPERRFQARPHRKDNPFATVAETLWTLAGRDDIAWLKYYLPRAADYSDDGHIWRGAYGPRLRAWPATDKTVDQVAAVCRELIDDPTSRRAVISLFDPARDREPSKDIPCNGYLQFLAGPDGLDMMVTARSCDAVWGWSGTDTFLWSVLHELVAWTVGKTVGTATYAFGSFHLYERHAQRARDIVTLDAEAMSPYEPDASRVSIATGLPGFYAQLANAFAAEEIWRHHGWEIAFNASPRGKVTDPFLANSLNFLRVYIARQQGARPYDLEELILPLEDDFRRVALAWYERAKATNRLALARELVSPERRDARADANALVVGASSAPVTEPVVTEKLCDVRAIKGRAYGPSWRKHGELLSIWPNVCRKADRIESSVLLGAPDTPDETVIDTFADLAVYCGLYYGWLASRDRDRRVTFVESAQEMKLDAQQDLGELTVERLTSAMLAYYNLVTRSLVAGNEMPLAEKMTSVGAMARLCVEAICVIARESPDKYAAWSAQWPSQPDWSDYGGD